METSSQDYKDNHKSAFDDGTCIVVGIASKEEQRTQADLGRSHSKNYYFFINFTVLAHLFDVESNKNMLDSLREKQSSRVAGRILFIYPQEKILVELIKREESSASQPINDGRNNWVRERYKGHNKSRGKVEVWKRTNDGKKCDGRKQSSPSYIPQYIFDIVHWPRGATKDDKFDIVYDQPYDL